MIDDKPTIAIAKPFLKAMSELSKTNQNQVRAFLDKFEKDPNSGSIHKETLHNAKDSKLFSAKVNSGYRVILGHDDKSNVYLLLYVGQHDDAYTWASRKRIDINTATNAVQLYDVVEEGTVAQPVPTPYISQYDGQMANTNGQQSDTVEPVVSWDKQEAGKPLPEEFLTLTRQELTAFGVPYIWQEIILQLRTYGQLQDRIEQLPDDCVPYLELIADGSSIQDVLDLAADANGYSEYVGLDKTTKSTTFDARDIGRLPADEDYRKALTSYASQENFVIVEGEDDLRRILDAPLEQWRVFLHPSQRRYVERNFKGPYRLTGGAGTGKTIVAMHRAKYLAARLVQQHSACKVLFTTYSRNLATDIKANLQLICTQEELKRIDVLNLDRYVANCLHRRGFDYRLTYADAELENAWEAAIAESGQTEWKGKEAFLRDEWEEVIKDKGIRTLTEYFQSSRRGRGLRMSRAQKASLWKVTEAYHRYMSEHKQWDIYQAMNMVEDALRSGRLTSSYAHIIVDEGQDFSAPAYRMLRAMVPESANDLFIVGDAQQRIYGKTVTLSQCGIAIQGRSRRLRINYRTTEQIRDAAERVFDTSGTDVADEAFKAVLNQAQQGEPERFDDLNGEEIETNDSHSLMQGPAPAAQQFSNTQEERTAVTNWIDEQIQKHDSDYERNICLVTPTNPLCNAWAEYLDQHGYMTYMLDKEAEDIDKPGIRIATMHRVKGLEFDTVIVADINPGTVPPQWLLDEATDVVSKRELCKQYRSLIYVALTRARKQAFMVGLK